MVDEFRHRFAGFSTKLSAKMGVCRKKHEPRKILARVWRPQLIVIMNSAWRFERSEPDSAYPL